jgi:hypothetical protein
MTFFSTIFCNLEKTLHLTTPKLLLFAHSVIVGLTPGANPVTSEFTTTTPVL